MDAWNEQTTNLPQTPDLASELESWFAVSGDMDDFIYYDDVAKPHSER